MTIKRYTATKDNTITNAFKENLLTRATDANMGASDILEVFSIYGQASTSSVEKARVLIEFPVTDIQADRASGQMPASGSVKFYLRLFNAEHTETTPSNFDVKINVLNTDWNEGIGLDMETYKDSGASNWISRSVGTSWPTPGSSYQLGFASSFTFTEGTEDLIADVTDSVEKMLDGFLPNKGYVIRLDDSIEDGSQKRSYYTKRFFARGSQHILKRPVIEARWDSSSAHTASLPTPYVRADEYIYKITNLKSSYKNYEKTTFKIHTRKKDWQPNLYTVATNTAPLDLVDESYYKIRRVADNYCVVDYSTGSIPYYSKLSYNASGSFFDFDMSILEPNYLYEISFLRKNENNYIEQSEKFKFRVDP